MVRIGMGSHNDAGPSYHACSAPWVLRRHRVTFSTGASWNECLQTERRLGPVPDYVAIEKLQHAALDRQRTAARHHHGRDDRIAAVIEGDRQGGPPAIGIQIGAAA